ncbi:hypothetical protein [Tunicatimonas pelagia]|uniref:hypothetical protein n=1 Tax=Tunicatimonas pelagia TaxID=931531 RepID=UPI002666D64A|nr:hypothetical protein [Tunicatimonas pelagia]WKN43332.1 hypothetical protein P0M28_30270 [Tunicatimonas pelagia]
MTSQRYEADFHSSTHRVTHFGGNFGEKQDRRNILSLEYYRYWPEIHRSWIRPIVYHSVANLYSGKKSIDQQSPATFRSNMAIRSAYSVRSFSVACSVVVLNS